jgi:hypothetical protein
VAEKPVRIDSRAVFEVNDSRLGIGTFNRPLLDAEARTLRKAWKQAALPGLEDFQIDKTRVSFVGKPEAVPAAWESLDGLLAAASRKGQIRKAS